MSDEKDIKRDQVVEYLFHAIQQGEINTGQTLSERAISAKLGVSRTPVREAFRQLEILGLVHSEPHKGCTVTSISSEQLEQLYDVREVLEGLGAKLMALRGDQQAIQHLGKLLDDAERYASSEDIHRLTKINAQFHMEIIRGSRNPYLQTMMQTLQTHIGLLMSTSLSQSGRPEQNLREHRMILSAIELGDGNLAESIAQFHVRNAYKNALRQLSDQNSIVG